MVFSIIRSTAIDRSFVKDLEPGVDLAAVHYRGSTPALKDLLAGAVKVGPERLCPRRPTECHDMLILLSAHSAHAALVHCPLATLVRVAPPPVLFAPFPAFKSKTRA